MRQLVLSVFPGIGLLDMAFEAEGFCVVRGPDLIWGGDIRKFCPPPGRFDGVIGGPPCQLFSVMKRLNPKAGEKHGNLIPEFERVVREALPAWFLMENVEAAPVPVVRAYGITNQLIRDVWVGGLTSRLRRFSFGLLNGAEPASMKVDLRIEQLALHGAAEPAVLAGGGGRSTPMAIGGSGKRKKTIDGRRHGPHAGPRAPLSVSLRAQGLPLDFLDDCPLTLEGKRHAIGNGVPLAMGRAVARAVRRALGLPSVNAEAA
jgi:DNA (cytosine-5)-methyltransferase 1